MPSSLPHKASPRSTATSYYLAEGPYEDALKGNPLSAAGSTLNNSLGLDLEDHRYTEGNKDRNIRAHHTPLASPIQLTTYPPPSLHSLTSFSNSISASPNIAVSTSVPELSLINSSTGKLVRQWPSPSLLTHLVSSHTLLLSGSADGCIRTHDIRIGSKGDFGDENWQSLSPEWAPPGDHL